MKKKTLEKLELRKKHVVFFLFFYPSYDFEKKCQKRQFGKGGGEGARGKLQNVTYWILPIYAY